jgi:hypothetical protein
MGTKERKDLQRKGDFCLWVERMEHLCFLMCRHGFLRNERNMLRLVVLQCLSVFGLITELNISVGINLNFNLINLVTILVNVTKNDHKYL